MEPSVPTDKVVASSASAAVATLIVFILAMCGLPVPPGVEGAVAVIAAAVGGYWKRETKPTA